MCPELFVHSLLLSLLLQEETMGRMSEDSWQPLHGLGAVEGGAMLVSINTPAPHPLPRSSDLVASQMQRQDICF